MIYADYAATTKPCPAARDAMLFCMTEAFGNASSPHAAGQAAKRLLEDARSRIASALGASPKEICFTSGGTESDNQALRTAAAIGSAAGKNHIVSTAFEHHAVLHTLDALRKEGFCITLMNPPETGIILPEQIEAALTPQTALVSVMYANNEIGTVQPVGEIGAICRRNGVLFHTDAVQAAGHLPIDVQAQQIDLLSLSGHKFYGPKGVGVLYAKKGIRPEPLLLGGAQERGIRAGTENLPGIAGMAAALEDCLSSLDAETERLIRLRDRLIAGLTEIPGCILNGDPVRRLPGNVSVCFSGIDGEALLLMLDSRGICASAGSACASGSLEPSHVLLAIGRPRELARGALRLTIGQETTDAEIEEIIRAVRECAAMLFR